MAWHLIKSGQEFGNFSYKEFMLDADADINSEPTDQGAIGIGSIAYVCADDSSRKAMDKKWMKNASGLWKSL